MIGLKETYKNLNDYNFESHLSEIIQRNFIDGDYNIELEKKKYGEDVNIIDFFFDKFDLCVDEKLIKIFNNYEEKSSTIVDILSKTLIDLISFIKIMTKFLDYLIKSKKDANLILTVSEDICERVLKNDSSRCESIFISYGLDIILDFIKEKPMYRNISCKLIFALVSKINKYSHLEILKAIKVIIF